MSDHIPVTKEPEFSVRAFGRIAGVVFSPDETFAEVAQRPTWLVPALFYLLISLSILAIFGSRVGWDKYLLAQSEKSSQWQSLSEQERERQVEGINKIAPYIGWFAGVQAALGIAVMLFAGAGILMFAFNAIAGADLRFKSALGVMTHALFPLMGAAGLLAVVIMLLKEPADIDLQNLVASNAAVFLDNEASLRMRAIASSADIFSFWCIALLAIGFHAANPKRISAGMALGIILPVWGLAVLVKVMLVSLGGR